MEAFPLENGDTHQQENPQKDSNNDNNQNPEDHQVDNNRDETPQNGDDQRNGSNFGGNSEGFDRRSSQAGRERRNYSPRGSRDSRSRDRRSSRSGSGGRRNSQERDNFDNRDANPETYTQIYIASIKRETGENDLKEAFEKFGVIESINVKEYYAFINYANHQDATNAVNEMNNKTFINGEVLKVQQSLPKSAQKYGRDTDRRNNGPGGDDQCFRCGGRGHWKNDCKARGGGRDRGGGRRSPDRFDRRGGDRRGGGFRGGRDFRDNRDQRDNRDNRDHRGDRHRDDRDDRDRRDDRNMNRYHHNDQQDRRNDRMGSPGSPRYSPKQNRRSRSRDGGDRGFQRREPREMGGRNFNQGPSNNDPRDHGEREERNYRDYGPPQDNRGGRGQMSGGDYQNDRPNIESRMVMNRDENFPRRDQYGGDNRFRDGGERRGGFRGGDRDDRDDRHERRGPPRNGGSRSFEEKQRIMREGRCFGCGEKGHMAKDCPFAQNQRGGPDHQERGERGRN